MRPVTNTSAIEKAVMIQKARSMLYESVIQPQTTAAILPRPKLKKNITPKLRPIRCRGVVLLINAVIDG
jgi:hypothetical protein